ncbi:hypothetical protein H4582DRAFT_1894995 [Lactarius indigo]|nr:hypothetical protein H4582DRAFT_1894995 [Lactarius indigo]
MNKHSGTFFCPKSAVTSPCDKFLAETTETYEPMANPNQTETTEMWDSTCESILARSPPQSLSFSTLGFIVAGPNYHSGSCAWLNICCYWRLRRLVMTCMCGGGVCSAGGRHCLEQGDEGKIVRNDWRESMLMSTSDTTCGVFISSKINTGGLPGEPCTSARWHACVHRNAREVPSGGPALPRVPISGPS